MKNERKNSSLRKEPLFTGSVFIYIFLVVVFVLVMRSFAKDYVINEIDAHLLMTARSLQYMLPDDFHDRAVSPDSISIDEYNSIKEKFTKIAEFSGMRYIWTDILQGDEVYLTTCNRTEQTDKDDLQMYYYMHYADGVSNAQMEAFKGEEPVFAFFSDRWGDFRAVFVPLYSPGGRKYLANAEYTTEYVDAAVWRSVFLSMGVAFFFFLAFVPVLLSYALSVKRKASELRGKNLELQKSEENLRITLNSIGDGVIVLNSEGKIVTMNPVAEKITGWSLYDALDLELSGILNISDHSTGEGITDFLCVINNCGVSGVYFSIVSRDGTERIISGNGSSIVSPEGYYIGSVIVFRDVTEQEKLQNELRQSQKMESIGQLAGGVAHDFNNMLSAIMGSAELISLMSDSEEIKGSTDIIISASKKASDLTHKLLAFSRKGERKNEFFDIHKCIKNSIALLGRTVDRKIAIELYLEAELSVVTGDDILFENLILNVGINARDAMPEGGIFKIETFNIKYDKEFCEKSSFDIDPGTYIKIILSDSGSGIPLEIKDKIFDPFFTTKQQGKGTGLGLYTVYGTVQAYRGLVTLESEEGKGTEIAISLPVSTSTVTKGENIKKEEHSGSGLILVVDDEQMVADALASILRSMGYTVLIASNGREGIELYRENQDKVKFVFLDMIMPVMGGAETFEELKKFNPEIAVIVVSGYTGDSSAKEMLKKGVLNFLYKPYDYAEIVKILNKLRK